MGRCRNHIAKRRAGRASLPSRATLVSDDPHRPCPQPLCLAQQSCLYLYSEDGFRVYSRLNKPPTHFASDMYSNPPPSACERRPCVFLSLDLALGCFCALVFRTV